MPFYHPKRIVDSDPLVHGVHIIKCRGCGRKFESLTPPDPNDPVSFYCAECLLKGNFEDDYNG